MKKVKRFFALLGSLFLLVALGEAVQAIWSPTLQTSIVEETMDPNESLYEEVFRASLQASLVREDPRVICLGVMGGADASERLIARLGDSRLRPRSDCVLIESVNQFLSSGGERAIVLVVSNVNGSDDRYIRVSGFFATGLGTSDWVYVLKYRDGSWIIDHREESDVDY